MRRHTPPVERGDYATVCRAFPALLLAGLILTAVFFGRLLWA